MLVDRPNRDRMATLIERFLNEEITAFAFDDELGQIGEASDDPTVDRVRVELWFLYDDLKDHTIVADKAMWDYLHRLLLLVRSDAQIETKFDRIWSGSQIIALALLITLGLVVVQFGWGQPLWALTTLFAIASGAIAWWRWHIPPEPSEKELTLTPFSSVAELRAVRRTLRGFKKRPYPSSLKHKRLRSPSIDAVQHIFFASVILPIFWLVFLPLILLWQTFPLRWETVRVITPEPTTSTSS